MKISNLLVSQRDDSVTVTVIKKKCSVGRALAALSIFQTFSVIKSKVEVRRSPSDWC